jgi:hypothetical protein
MLVTNEPEFDEYCKDTYVIDDDAGISEVANEGYFSEDDLPVDEMDEVPDEWFHSHLMDDTATVSSTFTPTSKNIVNEPEENEEMIDEVHQDFVVEEGVGQEIIDEVDHDFVVAKALSSTQGFQRSIYRIIRYSFT